MIFIICEYGFNLKEFIESQDWQDEQVRKNINTLNEYDLWDDLLSDYQGRKMTKDDWYSVIRDELDELFSECIGNYH